jgi:hypothetical protein
MAAVRGTLVAIVMFAVIAVVTVLRAHRPSTVIAGCTIPLVKGYVRTVRAVGMQDIPDNSEKITDSAFFKSSSNRSMAIPFTKFIAADMWVGNFVICRGRVRLEGNYKVRAAVAQLIKLI